MGFIDLPRELKFGIASHLHGNALTAFAQTCHTHYQIANSIRYKHIYFADIDRDKTERLLATLLSRRELATYIRAIVWIGEEESFDDEDAQLRKYLFLHCDDIRDIILGAIPSSEQDNSEVQHLWFQNVMNLEQSACIALILPLATGVQSIHLEDSDEEAHSEILADLLVRMLRSTTSENSDTLLANLTHLRIGPCPTVTIPAYKKLRALEHHGCNIDNFYSRSNFLEPFTTQFPGSTSGLKSLHLKDARISFPGLVFIISTGYLEKLNELVLDDYECWEEQDGDGLESLILAIVNHLPNLKRFHCLNKRGIAHTLPLGKLTTISSLEEISIDYCRVNDSPILADLVDNPRRFLPPNTRQVHLHDVPFMDLTEFLCTYAIGGRPKKQVPVSLLRTVSIAILDHDISRHEEVIYHLQTTSDQLLKLGLDFSVFEGPVKEDIYKVVGPGLNTLEGIDSEFEEDEGESVESETE